MTRLDIIRRDGAGAERTQLADALQLLLALVDAMPGCSYAACKARGTHEEANEGQVTSGQVWCDEHAADMPIKLEELLYAPALRALLAEEAPCAAG